MNTNDNMKITFEEFTVLMKEGLENCFFGNEEIDISIQVNPKINGNQTAIQIRRPGEMVIPNIYLAEYYEEFQQHLDLNQSIQMLYEEYLSSQNSKKPNLDLDGAIDKLFLTTINTDMNTELLKQVPSKQILDLSIIVRVLVSIDKESINTTLVTHDMMNHLHLTEQQLFEYAERNTRNIFPLTIEPINFIVGNILEDFFMSLFGIPPVPMFVISNESRNHGAGSLFVYPDTLETVYQKLGGDYYILPSSIHDLIAVPKSCCDDPTALKEIVGSINSNEVLPEEVLSNNVYHYDSASRQLAIWSEE